MRLTEADKKLAKLWKRELRVGDWVSWHGSIRLVVDRGTTAGVYLHDEHGQEVCDYNGTWTPPAECIFVPTSDQIFAKLHELKWYVEVAAPDDAEWVLVTVTPDDCEDTLLDRMMEAKGDTLREALAAALVKALEKT